jgi:type I restriction-modification system DNA methylase subunit/restriction endonuclease S subunit
MDAPNIMPNTNAFVSRFNGVISACRDVLRREGITGMDSMKHLTLYILARSLDKAECKRLKINELYAWERFIELIDADKIQASFDLLYNQNGNDLISHLDSLFGTKNFNFKLKGPDNHASIIKYLKSIGDFRALEGVVDILGMVYENHLGSGTNKSAMRDLGQFFTDRRVCNYMTSLCNPRILPDGTAESVLDPTMGTGGFLTAYVKYVNTTNPDSKVQWNKMQQDIAGYDIDEFVMSIGRINMYLSTGVIFDRIEHRNTLNNDVGNKGQRLKFKIILANEPFGVKGLFYKDCCQRVKDIGINGTKSEPLFLNLMMVALDDGGRCAVVVPDGVLTNDSKQHNQTRKWLLDHYELRRVVKMKGQFFSNTGCQSSILFFENTGNPTQTVEFWEVEQDANGAIVDNLIFSISRDQLDDKCSLDVHKYDTKTLDAHMGTYNVVKLGDIITKTGAGKTNSTSISNNGDVPFYGCTSVVPSGIHNTHDFNDTEYFLFAKSGGNAKTPISSSLGIGKFHHVKGKSAANIAVFQYKINDTNIISYPYLDIILKYKLPEIQALAKYTTGNGNVDVEQMLHQIGIPVPPLTIQNTIVNDISLFYNSAITATSLADSMKLQISAVLNSLDARNYRKQRLEDFIQILGGKRRTVQEASENGKYTFITCSIMGTSLIDNADFNKEAIIINAINGSGKCRAYYAENYSTTANNIHFTLKPECTDILLKFVHLYLETNIHLLEEGFIGSNQKKIGQDYIKTVQIPIPPLSVQTQVIVVLNEMTAQKANFEKMAIHAEITAKYILDNYLSVS